MTVAPASGAAFLDLDRTLISRSSSLSLAGTFRKRGLIRRRQVAKAAVAQLVFMRFGAGQGRVGQTADSAMSILRGLRVEEMREIVAEAWESVLRPLVYREALDLAEAHAERGEPVYIASAALQEAVEEVSRQLGFAGVIASRAEVRDGGTRVVWSSGCTGRRKRTLSPNWLGTRRWIFPRRPRTPTRTPTFRSSKRSATPSR